MATKKKLLQAAAGTAAASGGAGGLNVESVFSTYLYEGNGSAQVIENGINLGQSYGSGGISLVRSSQSEVHTSANNDFAYGSSNFTWEAWIMPQVDDGTLNSSNMYIFDHGTGGSGNGGTLTYNYSNGGLQYYDPTNSVVTSTQTISNYTWAHVAVVRSSGILKVYYNGSQIISFTSSHNFTDNSFIIGGYGGGGVYNWQGVIAEIRVSNTARYTNTFTPPTASFTSDSNTILLTGQGSTIVDNSSNALTLTAYGDAKASTFGPFDAEEAGEGGLVWVKDRTSSSHAHVLYDTNRGINKALLSDSTTSELTRSSGLTSFNSNGFSVGSLGAENNNGSDFASWTFRKAPKFFDVVTYTGNSTAGRTISHNLGTTVGSIIIKRTDTTSNWVVYHRGNTAAPETDYLTLNTTDATSDLASIWFDTAPTDTEFTLGDQIWVNASGATYVAYLFAHNDGDASFGPDGDADIIKCGSFTTDSGGNASVDIGFEPQWIIYKRSDGTSNWGMNDNMRGWADTYWNPLYADLSNAESGFAATRSWPTATGFEFEGQLSASANYIYIAIRRGPMAVPEDATHVFAMDVGDGTSSPNFISNFPVDASLLGAKSGSDKWYLASRLTGTEYLRPNLTNTAGSAPRYGDFDMMDAWWDGALPSDYQAWMWKRAPNYFDVVAYTGTGSAMTINHNLGVAPEMIWFKSRSDADNWVVYVPSLGNKKLYLNLTNAITNASGGDFNDTAPTDTVFSVGDGNDTNRSGGTHIAYLFASLDGVSKVGSYTGNGTGQNIDCGFSSGARFVLIKRTDSTSPWWLWDSERGIVSGAEPFFDLNSNAGETTGYDWLDPYSLGFSLPASGNNNVSSASYIFYAIA